MEIILGKVRLCRKQQRLLKTTYRMLMVKGPTAGRTVTLQLEWRWEGRGLCMKPLLVETVSFFPSHNIGDSLMTVKVIFLLCHPRYVWPVWPGLDCMLTTSFSLLSLEWAGPLYGLSPLWTLSRLKFIWTWLTESRVVAVLICVRILPVNVSSHPKISNLGNAAWSFAGQ